MRRGLEVSRYIVVGQEIRQATKGKSSYSHIQELSKRHLQGAGDSKNSKATYFL